MIISGFGLVFIPHVPVWKENFKVHDVGCVCGHDGVNQLPKMTKKYSDLIGRKSENILF